MSFAAAWMTFSFSSTVLADEGQPGLVKEKPESGHFVQTPHGYMVPYTETIPGTDVTFEMVPIPGGEFLMGSPDDDEERRDDEGPQIRIRVEPFWIGKYEVTWGEYKQFMALHDIFKKFETDGLRPISAENKLDVITAPSNLYDTTFTFEAGSDDRTPAATMTQYAARQYTKWLSLLTHDFYRIPTEAEWEYACRAGTTTRFYFGDDVADLDDHAWYWDNADDLRHEVGQKKSNPWGLYDMYGNVSEWVLDGYDESGYVHVEGELTSALEALNWPQEVEMRIVRGGSWELDPEDCRSAARMPSEDEYWKDDDPNFPKSPWWYTTSPATGVGMRIIRPLEAPASRSEREKFWEFDHEEIEMDVNHRIDNEGRGARGYIDDDLPGAIKKLFDR